MTAILFCRKKV